MKKEYSKFILTIELTVVTALSAAGMYFAYLSITSGYTGSLPWITAMVSPSWAAYGVSKAFYSNKAKAENMIKIPELMKQNEIGKNEKDF